MGRQSSTGLWAMFIVALGLTIGSALVVYREFTPLLQTGTTAASTVAALAARPVVPGLSYRSKRLVLDSCNDALNTVEGAVLQGAQRAGLLQNCRQISQIVVADSPSFSLAWYVGAMAAEGQGDLETMSADLVRSQITAPYQGWLALSRAILAERKLEELDESALAALDQDIAVLARSRRHGDWLATRYLRDQAFGERVTAVLETLPSDMQRQFIGTVRRVGQN